MVPLAFVTLVTPLLFTNVAVAPAPDGTMAGLQLDDTESRNSSCHSRSGRRHRPATGRWRQARPRPNVSGTQVASSASWLAPTVWNDGLLISCRRSPPQAFQELSDYRLNQRSK